MRRLARTLGVALRDVTGGGERGRIRRQDVEAHVKRALSTPPPPAPPPTGFAPDAPPDIDFSRFGPVETTTLTRIQRLSARNLHHSWVSIPHVTQFDSADLTELEGFRQKLRADHPEQRFTPLCFFVKALAHALRQMPRFNSSLSADGETLVLKGYVHVGVAVDTPAGLFVPVLRDADRKGLREIAAELSELGARARGRKLSPADMQGGSMTISSLGGIAGTGFTPIIQPPEVAILGISPAKWSPAVVEGAVVRRLLCPLSLSYDHRVIDGADAARFTALLCAELSDLRRLLL